MNRIVVNVATKEITVVPLTPEEVADAQARTAAEAALPVVKSELDLLKERVAVLEAK